MMKINKFYAFAWQFVIASGLQSDGPLSSFLPEAADDQPTLHEEVVGVAFPPDTAAAVTTSVEVSDHVPTTLEEVLAEAEGKKSSLLPWGYDDNTRLLNQNSNKIFSKSELQYEISAIKL